MRRWKGASFVCPLCGLHAADDPRYFCCAPCLLEVQRAMAEEWVRNRLASGHALTRDGLLAERVAARPAALALRSPCPTPPPQERPKKGPAPDRLKAVQTLLRLHPPPGLPTHKILRALRDAGMGIRKAALLKLLTEGGFKRTFSTKQDKKRTPVFWC